MSPQNPHLASVLFNSVAARSILKNRWSLPTAVGTDRLAPVAGKTSAITGFTVGSTSVKAIWEVVSNEGTVQKPQWPFRVYDPTKVMLQLDAQQRPTQGLMPVEGDTKGTGWSTKLFLDTADKSCPFAKNAPPEDIQLGQSVPIGCFVFHELTDATVGDTVVVGHSESPRYYLVLAGLHVARKEQSGWTWTTFWWTNRPSAEAAHFDGQAQNLPNVPLQYLHYAMDTSVAHPGPIYNPYQEGTEGPSGTLSSCAGCHSYAAIRIDPNTAKVLDTRPDFGLPGGNLPSDYFSGSITTDLSWTIATARNPRSDPGMMEILKNATTPWMVDILRRQFRATPEPSHHR
jgi:hypothetical protein